MAKNVKHTTVRSTRYAPDDYFMIQSAADAEGVSFSEFIRRAAKERVDERLGFGGRATGRLIPVELASHLCTAIAIQIITGTPHVAGLEDELERMVAKLMLDLGYDDADA